MPTAISTRTRGAQSRLLVALLFLLLTGVLGMHGWGSHGVAGAGHIPSAHHSGLAVAAATIPGVVGEDGSPDTPVLTGSPDSVGMPLAGLCVAVLSSLGFVLLLLRALRRRVAVPLPPSWPWHARRDPGRDRDPPSLARLSALRR